MCVVVEVTTESPVENEPVENEPSEQPSEIFKYATFALAAVAFISLLLNIVLIICLRRKTSTKGWPFYCLLKLLTSSSWSIVLCIALLRSNEEDISNVSVQYLRFLH